jgi:hypothetical protein
MSSPALSARIEKVATDNSAAAHQIRTPNASIPPDSKNISKPRKSISGASLVGMASIMLLSFGFAIKGRELIVPGEGIGYKFGLIGGLAMLALLFYPAFKRSRFFGNGKRAAFWFRWHMLLGIAGPLLIFFHSNFSLGAMNSNVALFTMILVAGSGVIGRYIYTQVHTGLSGARLEVGGLLTQSARLMLGVEEDVGGSGGLVAKAMADFSVRATPKRVALLTTLLNTLVMPWHRMRARNEIMKQVNKAVAANRVQRGWSAMEAKSHGTIARNHVNEFLGAVSRAAQFAFWERMFALWHILHVPLFFLLLVSGVIHVAAVHLY